MGIGILVGIGSSLTGLRLRVLLVCLGTGLQTLLFVHSISWRIGLFLGESVFCKGFEILMGEVAILI